MSIGSFKSYELLEIGTKLYVVFMCKRQGKSKNIIMMCKVDKIFVYEKYVYYHCKFVKFVTGSFEIEKTAGYFIVPDYLLDPQNIPPEFTNMYIGFTAKDKCKSWL